MTGARITLSNPTADNWDDFIIANANFSGAKQYMEMIVPLVKRAHGKPVKLPPSPARMMTKNDATGRNLILCGAGPSLKLHWEYYLGPDGIGRMPKTDVWACNSALTWLKDQGGYVTHGFAIDQTEGLLSEWASAPDVKYILASTVNPKVVQLIAGHRRQILWFHNYVGSATEGTLYRTIWPGAVMVGDGLNSANRAMCLAVQFMNYKSITVLGLDCCLGENDVMHANGDGPLAHGATPVIMENTEPIAGRIWRTKPDMLFSAVSLARMASRFGKRLKIVGDTLPAALLEESAKQPKGWLDKVARLEAMPNTPYGRVGAKGKHMISDLFWIPVSPDEVTAKHTALAEAA